MEKLILCVMVAVLSWGCAVEPETTEAAQALTPAEIAPRAYRELAALYPQEAAKGLFDCGAGDQTEWCCIDKCCITCSLEGDWCDIDGFCGGLKK